MELGFGGANAEICRCFFKPETNCCEWRDVTSVSSRLQKKYEQPMPVLSHVGCKELIWSPSGLPFKVAQAQKSIPRVAPTPAMFSSPCCPMLLSGWFGPGEADTMLKSEGSGGSRDLLPDAPPGSAEASGENRMPHGAQIREQSYVGPGAHLPKGHRGIWKRNRPSKW